MMYFYVWGDPRSGAAYVGRTEHLTSRKSHHRGCNGKNIKLNNWFQELKTLGLQPEFYVVQAEKNLFGYERTIVETFWIDFYLSEGAKLLNQRIPYKDLQEYWQDYPRKITRKQYAYNAETKELSVVKELHSSSVANQ
jgi:hypothetical protein